MLIIFVLWIGAGGALWLFHLAAKRSTFDGAFGFSVAALIWGLTCLGVVAAHWPVNDKCPTEKISVKQ